MKKYFNWLLALSLIVMSSCAKDELSMAQNEGMVEFSITTSIPGVIQTYSSEKGGASNVDATMYDLRYILEVWTNETPKRLAYRGYKIVDDNFATTDVTFTARLLALEYDFVFWADFVSQGTLETNAQAADLHYTTNNGSTDADIKSDPTCDPGLTAIEMKSTYGISADARDAYFAVKPVDLTQQSQIGSVTLYRPFGKYRLIATDEPEGFLAGTVITGAGAITVDYKTATFPNAFNALTGTASGATSALTTYTATAVKENAVAGGVTYTDAYVLAFDYIFASSGQPTISFDVEVKNGGTVIGQRELPNIPIQANKLTTIIGNFFTNTAMMNVIVSDPFDEGDIIETGDAIAQDITADYTLTIPKGSASLPSVTYVFTGTITSGVTISIVDEDTGAPYTGEVNIGIKNPTGASVDINLPGATVKFLGTVGNLTATTKDNTLTIIKNSAVTTLTIEKGNVEIYGTVTNLILEDAVKVTANVGSVAPANISGSAVSGSKFFWIAANAGQLRAALAFATCNDGVILTGDCYFDTTPTNPGNPGAESRQSVFLIEKDGYIFDGGGYTLKGIARNQVLLVRASGVTVKNVTVDAEDNSKSGLTVYSMSGENATATLENVKALNGKAGIIINGAKVTATGLYTAGNAWGGVNVAVGSENLGEKPEFSFDDTSAFNEAVRVWVDVPAIGYAVTPPSGWASVSVNNGTTQIFRPEGEIEISEFVHNSPGWVKNRYDVASWAGVTVAGKAAIKSTVNSTTSMSAREATYATNFYNTQGKGIAARNIGASTDWDIEAEIYISADMLTTSYKPFYIGVWGDANAYPIIAASNAIPGAADTRNYTAGAMTPLWKLYKSDGTWVDGPALTAGWHKTKMTNNGGIIEYYINDAKVGAFNAASGSYPVESVMIQNYNFTEIVANGAQEASTWPGYEFDAYFTNVKVTVRH